MPWGCTGSGIWEGGREGRGIRMPCDARAWVFLNKGVDGRLLAK